jgi:hypothetical protein
VVYDELAYPLAQLRAYFNSEPSVIVDPKMGEIVTFYVKAKVEELKQFAAEFDSFNDEGNDLHAIH